MEAQPAYGLTDLLTHVINDMAQAVAARPGETQTQRIARAQAAAQTILAFLPCDAVEAMIAGHCMMLHELIVASIRTTLAGELDATRRATRSNIVAMDRAFGSNLKRLECYRRRDADDAQDAETADRVQRHAPTISRPSPAETTGDDPNRSARQAEVTRPSEAAQSQMPGMNRQARREMRRQANKKARPGLAAITPVRNAPATRLSATPAN